MKNTLKMIVLALALVGLVQSFLSPVVADVKAEPKSEPTV